MPRYELPDGARTKWFEVELDGATCVSKWGVVGGSSVKRSAKSCASPDEAQKTFDKILREKEKTGWKLAGGAARPKTPKTPPKAKPATTRATGDDQALLDAIIADPDSDSAWLVYADHLQTNGDPRGELMALQHQLESLEGAAMKKVATAASKLLDKHRDRFLPPEAVDHQDRVTLRWRRGFLRSIRYSGHEQESDAIDELVLGALLAHPSARLLNGLHIAAIEANKNTELDYSRLARLIAKRPPPLLRALSLDIEEWQISWSRMDVAVLSGKLPRLEQLHLHGGSVDLGKAEWPSLRKLTVETNGLCGSEDAVGKQSYPHLEELSLSFGEERYGGSGSDGRGCKGILAGKGLPKLTKLGLTNAEFSDELCALLPRAAILPRLKTLDLSDGTMTDEGIAHLLKHADRFAHLDVLDLHANCLDQVSAKAVKKLCKNVIVGDQKDPEEERYASVGE